MFYILMGSFAFAAVLACGWVSALDAEWDRARARAGKLPTIDALPRAVAIPTFVRKRWK